MIACWLFFFFSSRRRHTRCSRDWSSDVCSSDLAWSGCPPPPPERFRSPGCRAGRSEEHTSELQSRLHLVCRLLLEKKKRKGETTSLTSQHVMSGCPVLLCRLCTGVLSADLHVLC